MNVIQTYWDSLDAVLQQVYEMENTTMKSVAYLI